MTNSTKVGARVPCAPKIKSFAQDGESRLAFGLFVLVVMLGLVSLFSLLSGCVYRGAKIVEGTDLAVGINVPSTEGALQLQLMNYLSGFRLAIAENAALTMTYSTAESNNYFGVISTRTTKQVSATVSPTETTPTDTADD